MSSRKNTKQHVYICHYTSPCGKIVLGAIGETLCLSDWYDMPCAKRNMLRLQRTLNADFVEEETETLRLAKILLDEYFSGKRQHFNIPLLTVGTCFQKRVWQALLDIPFGETRSYKQIAQNINNPKGVRAVAQAIGANGISIFVPCHRVIGSNHTLTGFSGGLEAKKTLLQLESKSNLICPCPFETQSGETGLRSSACGHTAS